jgi:hypothetical protein
VHTDSSEWSESIAEIPAQRLAELRAIPPKTVSGVNLHVPSVVATVLAVAPKVQALRPDIHEAIRELRLRLARRVGRLRPADEPPPCRWPRYTGDTEADMAKIGWYTSNSDNKLHDVGLKKPNAWASMTWSAMLGIGCSSRTARGLPHRDRRSRSARLITRELSPPV